MADQLITGTTLIEDKRSEKGEVWSATGVDFIAIDISLDDVNYDNSLWGEAVAVGSGIVFNCAVHLPNGATITSIKVFGNVGATAETYTLLRNNFAAGTAETLATANIGTEDTTISSAVINNEDFHYFIRTSSLDTTDTIYGAVIKYEF